MATQTKYPDANTLLAEYNKSGNLSIEQMLGGAPAKQEISSENLDSTQKPIVVPPPVPETAGAKYDMTTAGVFTEPEKTDRQEQIGENNTRMMEILGQLTNQPKEALREQEKAGLFDARKQLGELNKEKKLLDAAYFENVKAIEKNTEGKFGGAVQQDLRNLEREYRDNDYKLAVRKSVANEDISTALAISEAYINAKYEPLKIELQGLKDFAEISSNDLSDSESLQLQAQITQKQKALDAATAKETKDNETKINLLSAAAQQGAPQSVQTAIMNAKTVEEAITAAGQYGGDVLARQIQLEQLRQLKLKGAEGDKEKIETVNKQIATVSKLSEKTALIDEILTSSGLSSRVGVGGGSTVFSRTAFSPIAFFTGSGQEFAGKVKQLTSQETLDTLLALKQGGGTLGAVNEKEFATLEGAATAINTWEVKDPETGLGIGQWNISEDKFAAELKKLKSAANKIIESYLSYDPSKLTPEQTEALNSLGAMSSDAPAEDYY